MRMRDYVDGIQGPGSWDQMHDLIDKMQIFGWEMPPIEVDGHTVNIFPGTNREVMLEDVQNELRRAFAQVEAQRSVKH